VGKPRGGPKTVRLSDRTVTGSKPKDYGRGKSKKGHIKHRGKSKDENYMGRGGGTRMGEEVGLRWKVKNILNIGDVGPESNLAKTRRYSKMGPKVKEMLIYQTAFVDGLSKGEQKDTAQSVKGPNSYEIQKSKNLRKTLGGWNNQNDKGGKKGVRVEHPLGGCMGKKTS